MTVSQALKGLPTHFYEPVEPESFTAPQLITFNKDLAEALKLGLNSNDEEYLALIFSGQKKLDQTLSSISMAYAGHQFGHFVPALGDGRAVTLFESQINSQSYDVQLKGSGRTPYSRRGDGRSSLGPVLREYIVSEAMHALSVPTTRALAAVLTGDQVYREEILPGGVFTRVASSHLRVGTFQYYFARQDVSSLKSLLLYAVQRHYPHLSSYEDDLPQLAILFFRDVAGAQARLVAKWMSLGFIHGVMNTDNMTISGETIDYGPCAFMDHYKSDRVYSYIDQHGRYAYSNQPLIAQWNLTRLAECFIPLINDDQEKAIRILEKELEKLPQLFHENHQERMLLKLSLESVTQEGINVSKAWLKYLEKEHIDFTQGYLFLQQELENKGSSRLVDNSSLQDILLQLESCYQHEGKTIEEAIQKMKKVNPTVIPRNHDIEAVIDKAIAGDLTLFHSMLAAVTKPYQENPQAFHLPPLPEQVVKNTFCGT